jgi:hypothetical protein
MCVLINLVSVDAKGIPGEKCRGKLNGRTPRGNNLFSELREAVGRIC